MSDIWINSIFVLLLLQNTVLCSSSYYYYIGDPKTWIDAENNCESHFGGTLLKYQPELDTLLGPYWQTYTWIHALSSWITPLGCYPASNVHGTFMSNPSPSSCQARCGSIGHRTKYAIQNHICMCIPFSTNLVRKTADRNCNVECSSNQSLGQCGGTTLVNAYQGVVTSQSTILAGNCISVKCFHNELQFIATSCDEVLPYLCYNSVRSNSISTVTNNPVSRHDIPISCNLVGMLDQHHSICQQLGSQKYWVGTFREYLTGSFNLLHQFPMIQSNQTVGSPLITFTDTHSDTHTSICQTDIEQNNTIDLAQHPHIHHATTHYSTVFSPTTTTQTALSTLNSKTSMTTPTLTKSSKTYFTTSFIFMTSHTKTSSALNTSTSVPLYNSTYLQNNHITSTRSSNTGVVAGVIISFMFVVMVVIALVIKRRYKLLWNCRRKPNLTRNPLYNSDIDTDNTDRVSALYSVSTIARETVSKNDTSTLPNSYLRPQIEHNTDNDDDVDAPMEYYPTAILSGEQQNTDTLRSNVETVDERVSDYSNPNFSMEYTAQMQNDLEKSNTMTTDISLTESVIGRYSKLQYEDLHESMYEDVQPTGTLSATSTLNRINELESDDGDVNAYDTVRFSGILTTALQTNEINMVIVQESEDDIENVYDFVDRNVSNKNSEVFLNINDQDEDYADPNFPEIIKQNLDVLNTASPQVNGYMAMQGSMT